MRVAAVVPAYNEEDRLGRVLVAILQADQVDEVVVVNDGSTDSTAEVASRVPGIKLVNLAENVGKGGAMHAGAANTDAEIILFLDADLIGIKGEHIDSIVRPVRDGETDMCIGVFRGGRGVTDLAQFVTPYISGQRAMKRSTFLSIPDISDVRSGVEVAITKHFRSHKLTISTVVIEGCTHVMKEEKLGYVKGMAARLKMYLEIGKITFDGSRRRRNSRGRMVRRLRRLVGKKANK